VLLEFLDRILPTMVDPAITALLDSGLRVIIITHPERSPHVQRQLAYVDWLVSGGFGPTASAANYIFKSRVAHFDPKQRAGCY
jgi:hypothetical protein